MSPLQYQKHLRLQEARRIMLADDAGVALPRTRSAMKAHRSSAANTAACSARRCATSSAGGTRRRSAGLSDRLARRGAITAPRIRI